MYLLIHSDHTDSKARDGAESKSVCAKFDSLSVIITHTAEGEGQELEKWLTIKGTCRSSEGPEFSSCGPGSSRPSVTLTPGEL